jgi:hypothetical protein
VTAPAARRAPGSSPPAGSPRRDRGGGGDRRAPISRRVDRLITFSTSAVAVYCFKYSRSSLRRRVSVIRQGREGEGRHRMALQQGTPAERYGRAWGGSRRDPRALTNLVDRPRQTNGVLASRAGCFPLMLVQGQKRRFRPSERGPLYTLIGGRKSGSSQLRFASSGH